MRNWHQIFLWPLHIYCDTPTPTIPYFHTLPTCTHINMHTFIIIIIIIIIIVSVACVCTCAYVQHTIWRPKDNLQTSVLRYLVGSGNWTRIARLIGKCLYPFTPWVISLAQVQDCSFPHNCIYHKLGIEMYSGSFYVLGSFKIRKQRGHWAGSGDPHPGSHCLIRTGE